MLKKEIDEWKGKYVRALADYQNLEKRSQERVNEAHKFAAEMLLLRLVSVLDTFTKVKVHVHDVGFDLAYKEMLAVLQEQGIEHIEVTGVDFDPHTMECIEVVDLPAGNAGGVENKVVEEVLPGYMFRGKILRVAQVKVGKPSVTAESSTVN